MTEIPYVDIAGQHAPLRDELLSAIGDVIDSGHFILGPRVEEFERQFAELCGTRHAIGVGNGTDALVLSLRALGVGPGDEVVTAPNSFIASASAIKVAGAEVRFADVGEDYNLDPDAVEGALSERTKAIMPVHLTGRPADVAGLERYGLPVVEDAAQAVLAAAPDGKRVGALGRIGCFSLHPLKTLNALGDAGAITTDDDDLAAELRELRNIGLRGRDDAAHWSGNSRLDELQAAALLVKLRHLEPATESRRANAEAYRAGLADVEQIRIPDDPPGAYSVYHTFVVRAQRRDELRSHLAERGIGTAIHYPTPIHMTTIGRTLGYAEGSFPNTEAQAREIVSLPVHQGLSDDAIGVVCAAIKEFYA
jgi:dTDP-4-amino-4,6-dideoxygalactose transaminase